MFSLRKWVRTIADETVAEARTFTKSVAEVQDDHRDVMADIDGKLDDGCVLLFAHDRKLLPPAEWKAKAVAWQKEYKTEHTGSYFQYGSVWECRPDPSPLAVVMRRAILEANVEIAEAAQKDAKDALTKAKKAVTGAHS